MRGGVGYFDRHARMRRVFATALAAAVPACTSWRPAVGSPDAFVVNPRDSVRVQPLTGNWVVLYRPSVVGDSLIGYRYQGDTASRLALAMREVKSVEVRRFNAERTFRWVAIAGVATAVAVYLVRTYGHGGVP